MVSRRPEPVETTPKAVADSQIKPVAGIWTCPNCGRAIQVITDSETAKVQPFTCVCGAPMEPGEQHAVHNDDQQDRVVDD